MENLNNLDRYMSLVERRFLNYAGYVPFIAHFSGIGRMGYGLIQAIASAATNVRQTLRASKAATAAARNNQNPDDADEGRFRG